MHCTQKSVLVKTLNGLERRAGKECSWMSISRSHVFLCRILVGIISESHLNCFAFYLNSENGVVMTFRWCGEIGDSDISIPKLYPREIDPFLVAFTSPTPPPYGRALLAIYTRWLEWSPLSATIIAVHCVTINILYTSYWKLRDRFWGNTHGTLLGSRLMQNDLFGVFQIRVEDEIWDFEIIVPAKRTHC